MGEGKSREERRTRLRLGEGEGEDERSMGYIPLSVIECAYNAISKKSQRFVLN